MDSAPTPDSQPEAPTKADDTASLHPGKQFSEVIGNTPSKTEQLTASMPKDPAANLAKSAASAAANVKVFSPVAIAITQRPPQALKDQITNLKPPGNPDPSVLPIVKEAALKLVDTFPDADNVECKVEITGTANGRQILIQVIQHKFE